MILTFEDRPSDSPLVERIWRSRSDHGGPFLSIAESRFELCVTRHQGRTLIRLRGPETRATRADCPPDGEWLGIRFTLGTFMPSLPPGDVRDRRDATLPDASARAFWLDGSAWEYPDFENVDGFVARLARRGLLARDPIVDDALLGRIDPRTIRSCAAALPARHRHLASRGDPDRTGPARGRAAPAGDAHPRRGARGGLLRSGTSDPFAHPTHRSDAARNRPEDRAAVVSIQETRRIPDGRIAAEDRR